MPTVPETIHHTDRDRTRFQALVDLCFGLVEDDLLEGGPWIFPEIKYERRASDGRVMNLPYALVLDHSTGMRLRFEMNQSRLEIMGFQSREASLKQLRMKGEHKITVTMTRGLPHIAKNINGRLLPGYAEDYAETHARALHWYKIEGEAKKAEDLILSCCPGGRMMTGNPGIWVDNVRSVRVDPSDSAPRVSIEMNTVSVEKAIRILTILQED